MTEIKKEPILQPLRINPIEPDEGRLLTPEEAYEAVRSHRAIIDTKSRDVWEAEWAIAKAQDIKTARIKDAEYKDLGLLLKSKVGGVDEFNGWDEKGLRNFRQKVLPVIEEHCKKLERGHMNILHSYIDEQKAECQKRIDSLIEEIEKEFTDNHIVLTEVKWQSLKQREGISK